MKALLIGTLAMAGLAQADPPPIDEYGWRIPVTLTSDGDVHLLELTPGIYRSLADPGLGDLRLTDGDGNEVSFGALTPAPNDPGRDLPWALSVVDVAFAPVPETDPDTLQTLTLRGTAFPARVHIQLRTPDREDRAIQTLRIQYAGVRSLPRETRWWLESPDGRFKHLPLQTSMRFDGASGRGEARLQFDALPAKDTRNLWVRAEVVPSDLRITGAFAELEPGPGQPEASIIATPVAATEQSPDHQYRIDGYFPVHAAEIELQSGASLANIRLSSRLSAGQNRWQYRGETTVFDVRIDRAQLMRGSIPVDSTRDTEWRLHSAPELRQPPQLRLYYRPDRFLIAHTGPAQLLLHVGHHHDRRPWYPVNTLMRDLGDRLGDQWSPPAAMLGTSVAVRGPAALQAPPAPPPYRQWILWTALILASAVIAWMALRLLSASSSTANGEPGP